MRTKQALTKLKMPAVQKPRMHAATRLKMHAMQKPRTHAATRLKKRHLLARPTVPTEANAPPAPPTAALRVAEPASPRMAEAPVAVLAGAEAPPAAPPRAPAAATRAAAATRVAESASELSWPVCGLLLQGDHSGSPIQRRGAWIKRGAERPCSPRRRVSASRVATKILFRIHWDSSAPCGATKSSS